MANIYGPPSEKEHAVVHGKQAYEALPGAEGEALLRFQAGSDYPTGPTFGEQKQGEAVGQIVPPASFDSCYLPMTHNARSIPRDDYNHESFANNAEEASWQALKRKNFLDSK